MRETDRSCLLETSQRVESSSILLDSLELLLKRWKLIMSITISTCLITTLLAVLFPNIYTAKTMILPGEDDKGIMGSMMAQMGGLNGLAGLTTGLGGPSKMELYVTMLKSETIKDSIIDRFHLMDIYKAKLRAQAYVKLDANVMVTAGRKDGVLSIAVDDESPKRAAEMANAYVEELSKMAIGLNMSGAGRNRAFLEERLIKAKNDLANAEEAMKIFQTKNKVISVNEQAKASIEGVGQLQGRLVAQEVQLTILQQSFTESSNEVQSAKNTIANIKKQLAKLEGVGTSRSIPSVGSVPELGQEYIRLLRNFKIQETLVEVLTKQYEMVKISEVKNVSPFQLLQVAKVPEKKSKPARSKMVITALFASLLISIVIAFALERFSSMNEAHKYRWKKVLSFVQK